MKCTDLEMKNIRIKQEFNNSVYDIVSKAILATAKKYNYKKYDIFKLTSAIYAGEYGYITSNNDFRIQVKLLDEYFRKEYGHSIIIFEMVKTIKSYYKEDKTLALDIAAIETIIRTGRESTPENPRIFSNYVENEEFEQLFNKIEKENSLRYSVMIVYDRVKLNQINKMGS